MLTYLCRQRAFSQHTCLTTLPTYHTPVLDAPELAGRYRIFPFAGGLFACYSLHLRIFTITIRRATTCVITWRWLPLLVWAS